MRTMKIKSELVELPEALPNHPYFRSQAWSRKRNRAIYGMYVSEEGMTFRQVGEFWEFPAVAHSTLSPRSPA